jgi:pectin methylesterase-like acyl-CoA thioesterase
VKPNSWTLTALAALLFTLSASIPASAATLVVGDCRGSSPYTTVQQAVDSAAAGDTVAVCPATYAGAIAIDKNLTLEGIHATGVHPGEIIHTLPTITYQEQCRKRALP